MDHRGPYSQAGARFLYAGLRPSTIGQRATVGWIPEQPTGNRVLMERLSPALLDEYAATLEALGVPIVANLAPGLSDHEMDALTEPLGLRLPEEARIWWGWHNGVITPGEPSLAIAVSAWRYLKLERAVSEAQQSREISQRVGAQDPMMSELWPPTWLALLTAMHGGAAAIECAARDAVSPVHIFEWESGPELTPSSPSIGTMVRWWIEALDTGLYCYDRKQGWRVNWNHISTEPHKRALV